MPVSSGDKPLKAGLKVFFSLSARLIIVFAVILVAALLLLNNLFSSFASRELIKASEETLNTVNERSAAEAEDMLFAVRADVFILLDYIRLSGRESTLAKQAAFSFFERKSNIAAVVVPGYTELINNQFFIAKEISPGSVAAWVSGETSSIERARQSTPVITNPSVEFGAQLLAMFLPWQQTGNEQAVIILFSPDTLADLFSGGNISTFMLNSEGDVMIHPDNRIARNGINMFNNPLFAALSTSQDREIDLVYKEDGVKYLGSGKKLSLGGLMVFSSAEYSQSVTGISRGMHRNVYLIFAVVFISLIIIWLLSATITSPLRQMEKSISAIMSGDFNIKPGYNFNDELGRLSKKITEMADSLEKRERFLNVYKHSVNQDADVQNDKAVTLSEKPESLANPEEQPPPASVKTKNSRKKRK